MSDLLEIKPVVDEIEKESLLTLLQLCKWLSLMSTRDAAHLAVISLDTWCKLEN